MSIKVNSGEVRNEDVEYLLNRIMDKAKFCENDYQKDKHNNFNQGLAQAYTEILDVIQAWCEVQEITINENLADWAVKHLG